MQQSDTKPVIMNTTKWFKYLHIGLLFVETDFWRTGNDGIERTTQFIEERYKSLRNGIKITGPLSFQNEFNINDLIVSESINGISSSCFGTDWLLAESSQVNKF